jgi:rubrerythrin
MSDRLSVQILDEDATFAAAFEDPWNDSRSRFLQKAVVAGGTLLAGGILVAGLPRVAASAPSPAQDAEILNFALLAEYLEAAFYGETASKARVNAELLEYAKVVGGQERAHVAFLQKALGNKARKRPTFDFGNTTTNSDRFAATAVLLHETVVAAYNGQAGNLTKPTLAAAAKIVSVEARHAGWIRAIVDKNPAPNATDTPKTAAEVTAAVNRTAFIKSS